MFDSLALPRRTRSRTGLPVSVLLHIGVLVLALLAARPGKRPLHSIDDVVPIPGPPRRLAGSESHGHRAADRVQPGQRRHRPMEPPRSVPPEPQAAPSEIEPEAARADPEALSEASDDGSIGGPADVAERGSPGAAGSGGDGSRSVREFRETMSPPRRLSGPDPQYTPQALEHEVEGTMLVRCVVTVEGTVHGCRVVKSLPFMDRAVIDALEQRRYAPALENGIPVEVEYAFVVKLRL
jgi:protein TonB